MPLQRFLADVAARVIAMFKISLLRNGPLVLIFLFCSATLCIADGVTSIEVEHIVNETIPQVMAEYRVPGMAVGITLHGDRHCFYYGLAAKDSGRKVTGDTLFEIGSVSKTFTATLAAWAQERGALALSDKASLHLPALAGSAFDKISLLDLGTCTAGGLPLQFPNKVTSEAEMLAYFKNWRPAYAPGTHRLYSNLSVGLLGYLAAQSLGKPFVELMEKELFPNLGLEHTYINVPQEQMENYACGYSKTDKPVRMSPGILAAEAYGVKATATDILRFIEANMHDLGSDNAMGRALRTTQTGYFKRDNMTQGLVWEMYAWPLGPEALVTGSSPHVNLKDAAVIKLDPPLPPRPDVLLNKTGTTNGFGTYVAFIPARRIGVVLLANKNYPTPVRVNAAYQILTALEELLAAADGR